MTAAQPPSSTDAGDAFAIVRSAVHALLVEDESLFAKAVSKRLNKSGIACTVVGSLADAMRALTERLPDLVLLDLRLPDGSGMDFLHSLRGMSDSLPVIVLTAFADVEEAVQAMKQGAADYLKKPVDLEELLVTVERVLDTATLRNRLIYSQSRDTHTAEGGPLLGHSAALREVRAHIQRLARLTSAAHGEPPNVLILGETGSGKDVGARLLHAAGARANKPFVHVDCTALPRDLMEAELFGHEKGAFTSAAGARVGLIEAAEDGSVFLDEIGELPVDLQAKLLSVLERRQVRRLGSSRELPVRAQFIAATNRPLQRLVGEGAFRADLFYRLNVLTLTMPPLRDRPEDVLLLAEHFAQHTARRYGLPPPSFTDDARAIMQVYAWPGNVRELKHLIERAVLLASDQPIDAALLGLTGAANAAAASVEGPQTLEANERLLIQSALESANGNVSEAARRLGISRMTLRYRMGKYGL
ncbi:MAG TPA: sigma-54 dependent transcriptional regulator [Burkholderiales bacterium]|nr:sigma-54 dependent transcriptional regulator [Burkholderiales bacterium]